MKEFLLATSIVVILAVACTGTVTQEDPRPPGSGTPARSADPSPFQVSDVPEPPISLAGTSWLLAIMDGGDVQVGDAPDITLEFHHSRLVGFSGCNRFGARWQRVEGHLAVGRITSTLLRCRGPIGRMEHRLLHILASSPVLGNGGVTELRLTGGDGVLVFDRSD